MSKFKIVKIVKTLVLGRLEDEALDRCAQGEEVAPELLQAAAAERDRALPRVPVHLAVWAGAELCQVPGQTLRVQCW